MRYRINYSKVIAQVNSIMDNIAELSDQIKILEQMEQDCRNVWKGQAADTFIAKLNTLCDEMNRTKKQMASLASTIKFCADRIKKEDEQINKKAFVLKSGH